jgi:hypothetical protein
MSVLATVLGGGVISKVAGWVGDYFSRRQQIKKTELELNLELQKAKTQAQIDLYKTGLVGDIAWEKTAQDNSGWKDELLVIVFCIPLIGGFIPGCDAFIIQGFNSFDKMPDWYQAAIGVIIASVFGVRKFSEFMAMKKGVNLSRINEIKELVASTKDTSVQKKK